MITKTKSDIVILEHGELDYGLSFILLNSMRYKEHFHSIKSFNSGNDVLDEFLNEAHNHNECITYLFLKDNEVIAFCSMSCSSIFANEIINDKSIRICHPAIEYRYFAVLKKYHSKRFENTSVSISSYIFEKCLIYAYDISKNVMAAEYLVLHARNEEKVRRFYKKHNFNELPLNMAVVSDETLNQCIPAFLKIP